VLTACVLQGEAGKSALDQILLYWETFTGYQYQTMEAWVGGSQWSHWVTVVALGHSALVGWPSDGWFCTTLFTP